MWGLNKQISSVALDIGEPQLAKMLQVPYPPSIHRNEFNCPHCGAHSHQTWFELAADEIANGGTPTWVDPELIPEIKADPDVAPGLKKILLQRIDRLKSGLVFIEKKEKGRYLYNEVNNLHLSYCFTCNNVAVWVHDSLLFPNKNYLIPPNQDLPDDIKRDYEEASEILSKSPRGCAALLRLAIQKLCVYLGEPGKNLNDDIASLVGKGLDRRIQQALDVVRVIGNNAVHPGQMDMKDGTETARTLFGLVNLIAEKMISEPKHVQVLFDSLPENDRKKIEKRDN